MPRSRSRDLTWFPRLLGLATAGYSVAIIARPALFARPTKLVGEGEQVPAAVAVGVRAIGGRDLASGLAMAFAPAGGPLRAAVAVRVGCDVADLAVLGATLPDRDARLKAAGVASLWGALCALSARAA